MMVIRTTGPLAFFSAMAILPGFGVPALTFTLTVAEVSVRSWDGQGHRFFPVGHDREFLFTYALARRALRPLLERLINALAFKLPHLDQGGALSWWFSFA
jgi:hypothetical protein